MRLFPARGQSLSVDRGDYQMSRASRLFLLRRSGGVVLAKSCVEVPVVPKALRRSASVCGVFLAAEQAVRRKCRRTERPSEKEKSFWS
ncbi:hypothetical protein NDU88_002215 [Pleurodeles waltl]|uniref:Uncharacterized protein n=1 Tax=Pleurodeles waltl TaxID=8319 RepID=A0AAV7PDF1_PLEWA|nr:hypothetical protein NDU88_002215 [Pleurodeles waltl]